MTDIKRKRGDTYPIEYELTNVSDITGYTFILTVDPDRAPTSDANNIFQSTGIILDTSGIVQFPVSLSDVSVPGNYYFDVQMTDNNGKVRTIDHGRFVLAQDITK